MQKRLQSKLWKRWALVETKKGNRTDFSGRVSQEEKPKGIFKKYGVTRASKVYHEFD